MKISNILVIITTLIIMILGHLGQRQMIKEFGLNIQGNGKIVTKYFGQCSASTIKLDSRFNFTLDPTSHDITIKGDENILNQPIFLEHTDVINFKSAFFDTWELNFKELTTARLHQNRYNFTQPLEINIGVKGQTNLNIIGDRDYPNNDNRLPLLRSTDTLQLDTLDIYIPLPVSGNFVLNAKVVDISVYRHSLLSLSGKTEYLNIEGNDDIHLDAAELDVCNAYLKVLKNCEFTLNASCSVDGIMQSGSSLVNHSKVSINTLKSEDSAYTEI